MPDSKPRNSSSTYIRLDSNASTELLSVDETFWQRLMGGQLGDFHKEFLIASYSFDADWTSWEMHPHGDEIVFLLTGSISFIFEEGSGERSVDLDESGTYVIVPKGIWHTARVKSPSRILAITPGEETKHREAVVWEKKTDQ